MTTLEQIVDAYPKSREFAWKIIEVANELDIDPSWLANIIQSESKFDPQALNPKSNAAGLIQFIPSTAQSVIEKVYNLELSQSGSTEYVLSLPPENQMDMVKSYLASKGKLKSQTDVVLAVFYPYAIGKGEDFDIADHYAYKKGKYPRGTAKYIERYRYLQDINGGITYAGDYEKKLSPTWKLQPAPPKNGSSTDQKGKVGSLLLIGFGIASIYFLG